MDNDKEETTLSFYETFDDGESHSHNICIPQAGLDLIDFISELIIPLLKAVGYQEGNIYEAFNGKWHDSVTK